MRSDMLARGRESGGEKSPIFKGTVIEQKVRCRAHPCARTDGAVLPVWTSKNCGLREYSDFVRVAVVAPANAVAFVATDEDRRDR